MCFESIALSVSYIVAEVMTLTEPLRKSDGGREDDSNSDSDDETRGEPRNEMTITRRVAAERTA